MSENGRQSQICIIINDKSQDSTAEHLRYDGLLQQKLIIQFAGERIFKIGEHFVKLQAKWLSYAPIALDFCHKRCRSSQISKITCI